MTEIISQRLKEEPKITKFQELFSGLEVYLVGGFLPSLLMAKPSNDFDFTFPPSESDNVFKVLKKQFGKEPFLLGKTHVEKTYRISTEWGIIDLTEFQESIEENLIKRDLTVNSIAVRLSDAGLIDPLKGLDDILQKRLAFNSEDSVVSDPIRILRFFRMLSRFPEFTPDERSLDLIKKHRKKINETALERIGFELKELFAGKGFILSFKLMTEMGITEEIFSELLVNDKTVLKSEKIFLNLEILEKYLNNNPFEFTFSSDEKASVRFTVFFDFINKYNSGSVTEMKELKKYFSYISEYLKPLNIPIQIKGPVSKIGPYRNEIIQIYHKNTPSLYKITRLFKIFGDDLKQLILFSLIVFESEHLPEEGEPEDFIIYCQEIYDEYKNSRYIESPALVTGNDLLELGYEEGPEIGRALYLIEKRTEDGYITGYNEALDYAQEILHYRISPTKKFKTFRYFAIAFLFFFIYISSRIFFSEINFKQALKLMSLKSIQVNGIDLPIKKLNKGKSLFPRDFRFYSSLADCYEIKYFIGKKDYGTIKTIIEYRTEAVARAECIPYLSADLGRAWEIVGENRKALSEYSFAMEKYPRKLVYRIEVIRLLKRFGEYENARDVIIKGLEFTPNDKTLLTELEEINEKLGIE
ncbi:MAG: hypothetical protein PHV06_06705 [bacterium]|nr:hypothetical protein [bacterium]